MKSLENVKRDPWGINNDLLWAEQNQYPWLMLTAVPSPVDDFSFQHSAVFAVLEHGSVGEEINMFH